MMTQPASTHLRHSRPRLNGIAHILDRIPHKKLPREPVKIPDRLMEKAYDDSRSLKGRKFVRERY